jgi:hypothetical protein
MGIHASPTQTLIEQWKSTSSGRAVGDVDNAASLAITDEDKGSANVPGESGLCSFFDATDERGVLFSNKCAMS